MKKVVLGVALSVLGTFAQAETYVCDIHTYGSPLNFGGTRPEQVEYMTSWLPSPEFKIVVDGTDAVIHHDWDPALSSRSGSDNGATVIYTFQDGAIGDDNKSTIRKWRFVYRKADGTFSVALTLNSGPSFKLASGSARGTCVIK